MTSEAVRERIQRLLVTGDNRLKQGVAPEKVRGSYEQALELAREGRDILLHALGEGDHLLARGGESVAGPMALEELTTYKYVIRGAGQIRE